MIVDQRATEMVEGRYPLIQARSTLLPTMTLENISSLRDSLGEFLFQLIFGPYRDRVEVSNVPWFIVLREGYE